MSEEKNQKKTTTQETFLANDTFDEMIIRAAPAGPEPPTPQPKPKNSESGK